MTEAVVGESTVQRPGVFTLVIRSKAALYAAWIPLQGFVAWINPAHSAGNRPQGIGVQLQDNEVGRELRKKVEGLLAGALQSSRPTHTI